MYYINGFPVYVVDLRSANKLLWWWYDNGSGKENGDGWKRNMVERGNNMTIYEVLERI